MTPLTPGVERQRSSAARDADGEHDRHDIERLGESPAARIVRPRIAGMLAACVVLLLGACGGADPQRIPDDARVAGPRMPGTARAAAVKQVVDGDTVELAGVGRSRLIGVDTPEVFGERGCFGEQASAYAKRVLDGRRIRYLTGVEPRDRYGRALVYIWLGDGRSFNAMLVDRGYARPLTIAPNVKYARILQRLAERARTERRGLWAAC